MSCSFASFFGCKDDDASQSSIPSPPKSSQPPKTVSIGPSPPISPILTASASPNALFDLRDSFVLPPSDDRLSICTQLGSHEEPLDKLNRMDALLKTVQNDYWRILLQEMAKGPLCTPTSLPPPGVVGMSLYSSVSKATCGLVWDLEAIDMQNAYIFPSGFFAKTEFNIDATGRLMDTVDSSKLTTIEQLRIDNCTKPSEGNPIKYNEVYAPVSTRALIAVFVRSTQHRHLLFAMGVRAKVLQELGVALPLIALHDDPVGAQPVMAHQLVRVLRSTPFDAYNPRGLCFPVDIRALLAPTDQDVSSMEPPATPSRRQTSELLSPSSPGVAGFDTSGNGLIDAWDLSGDGQIDAWDTKGDGRIDAWDLSGDGVIDAWDTRGDGKINAWDTRGDGKIHAWDTRGDGQIDAWDLTGDGTIDAWDIDGDGQIDHYACKLSAREAALFHGYYGCVPDDLELLFSTGDEQQIAALASLALRASLHSSLQALYMYRNNAPACKAVVRRLTIQLLRQQLPTSTANRVYESVAGRVKAREMLSAVGVLKLVISFLDGDMHRRCCEVIAWLREWTSRSGSLKFRFESWLGEKKQLAVAAAGPEEATSPRQPPGLTPFLTNKVTQNRKRFGLRLEQLESVMRQDRNTFCNLLCQIVHELHEPALRLDLLCYVVGVDSRWTVDTLQMTCEFFHQINASSV